MMMRVVAAALMGAAIVGSASAQTKKSSGPKSVMHAITIKADEVYTGTMEMAVDRGKVTGNLHLTAPTEITGKVAGTAKGGVLSLEFPYHMVERNCDGTVKMNITLPATPGPAAGTMEAGGCGRDPDSKLPGTVELVPVVPKKK
jgi:hypothetical protein